MKQFFTLCFFLVATVSVYAQDIIIKTDKSEIKAKVLEVEEYNIKYKQWDFQDGPTYSVKKNDVFMIIYKNGKRETFETTAPAPVVNNNYSAPVYNNQTQAQTQPATTGQLISASNILGNSSTSSDGNVNYLPMRITFSYMSLSESGADGGGLGINIDQDYSLMPNFLNWGTNVFSSYTYMETDYFSSESFGIGLGLYALSYLPVNRVMGNLENQNTGFFPFIKTGYQYGYYTTSSYTDGYGGGSNESSAGAGAFYWVLGADYKFSEKFGLTVYTSQFNAFSFGLNIQL